MASQPVTAIPPQGYLYSINNKNRQYISEPAFNFTATFVNGDIRTMGPTSYQVVVKEAIISHLIPNIHKYNNVLQVKYNGIVYTLVMASLNYSLTTFLSVINTFFQSGAGGGIGDVNLSISVDATSYIASIKVPLGSTFMFVRPVTTDTYLQNLYNYSTSPNDRFMDLLGFPPPTFGNVTYTGVGLATATLTGVAPVNLYGTTFVDVGVNANLGNIHMGFKNIQHLCRIPMNVPYGSVKVHKPTIPNTFNIDADALATLHYTLYDEWGQIVDTVPDNTSFSMCMLIIPNNRTG